MNIYEAIKINEKFLKLMSKYGIKANDYKYIELYEDYKKMKAGGDKVTYISSVMSNKYGMSERSVFRIISRFGKECHM